MNSLIFILVAVALFIVPFFVFGGGSKGKTKKTLVKALDELAEKNNSTIGQTEYWNSSIMGLCNDGKKLFFITTDENIKKETVVDLNSFRSSRVNIVSRTVEGKGNVQRVVEKISLILNPNIVDSRTVELVIYDTKVDGMVLGNELQIVEKWNVLINDQIAAHQRNNA